MALPFCVKNTCTTTDSYESDIEYHKLDHHLLEVYSQEDSLGYCEQERIPEPEQQSSSLNLVGAQALQI